ncbi:MAG: hypothetical protein RLZZ15_1974 [Verrucomicrobiota bacterium]|jgi:nucleoid-associated protein YgaU
MRFSRALLALPAALALTGCGYVHFGKLPEAAAPALGGDAATAKAYSDLGTENKLLKQELALVRKEGDTLRAALDRRAEAASPEVATRLQESTRELAALRASYAKLQAERATAPAGPGDAALRGQLRATEDKLAAILRNQTELQDENARLRTDVTRVRAENSGLVAQLKLAATRSEQAEASLAQLNGELLAQKDARSRAEQQAAAVRAQLTTVMAAAGPSLAATRAPGAAETTALAPPARAAEPPPPAPAKPADSPTPPPAPAALALNTPATAAPPPTAELRTSATRLASAAELTVENGKRYYVVRSGDTLESISKKFYGTTSRWAKIYVANNDLLRGDRPLKPGMKIDIPAD